MQDSQDFPQFIHHGAIDGVTGSCHEYRFSDTTAVLVDCGLFQGAEAGADGDAKDLRVRFPLAHIKALTVTHVHIDHVGRIPHLFAAGFDGPIFCTEASAKLLPLVLEDALKVGVTRDEKLITQFLQLIRARLHPCAYGRWVSLPQAIGASAEVKFKPAGHILGSAYVEFRHRMAGNRWYKTVFSGDLGASYAPLLPSPKSPYSADTLVIESTYGDRMHEGRSVRAKRLQKVIAKALQDNGSVLIPAFSIGRTQELLYELEAIIHRMKGKMIHRNLAWDQLQVIVDSPLAARFTEVYRDLEPFWDTEARRLVRNGRHPLSFEQLHTIESHAQHERLVNFLAQTKQPAIILAASGMCQGGRIVNYLKAMLGAPEHQVLFVGYQARGTLGAAIQTYGPSGGYVDIDDERIDVRAGVETLSGYSAHADQAGLLSFVRGMRKKPRQIRIVHGDDEAKVALQYRFKEMGLSAVIPD